MATITVWLVTVLATVPGSNKLDTIRTDSAESCQTIAHKYTEAYKLRLPGYFGPAVCTHADI